MTTRRCCHGTQLIIKKASPGQPNRWTLMTLMSAVVFGQVPMYQASLEPLEPTDDVCILQGRTMVSLASAVKEELNVVPNKTAQSVPQPSISVAKKFEVTSEAFVSINRVLVVVLPLLLCLIVYFLTHMKSWCQDSSEEILSKQMKVDEPSTEGVLLWGYKNLPKLLAPYLTGSTWAVGWQYIGVILVLVCLACFVDLEYNFWEKLWWDAVYERNASLLVPALVTYVGIMIAFTSTEVFATYVRNIASLHWRRFMTDRLMDQWLCNHTHCVMQLKNDMEENEDVDNPEQRIQEDVHAFTSQFVNLFHDFLLHLAYLLVFVAIVYRLCPTNMFGVLHLKGWIVYLFVIYAGCGTYLIQCMGQSAVSINFHVEKSEANFRMSLHHINDNSESIAVCNSARVERASAQQNFGVVERKALKHFGMLAKLECLSAPYNYVQWMLPFFVLMPSYFAHEISLGDLFQLNTAVGHVIACLDWFMKNYETIAEMRTHAERLLVLEARLEAAAEEWKAMDAVFHRGSTKSSMDAIVTGKDPDEGSGKQTLDGIGHEQVCVATAPSSLVGPIAKDKSQLPCAIIDVAQIRLPTGELLWNKLKLELFWGQRVLISGAEGQGKSMLFKVLAGTWPYVAGGEIRLPDSVVLFVPQKPILPSRCTLRRALSYPDSSDTYSDEALLHALQEVGLSKLLRAQPQEDENSEDEDQEWEDREDCDGEGDDEEEGEGGWVDENELTAEEKIAGLDLESNWALRLSPGMRQRLAFGHIIVRKPSVVFLDEATCHVSTTSAAELYGCLFRNLSESALIVSVTHDVATMAGLHDTHYIIAGGGKHKKFYLAGHSDLEVESERTYIY